jgi:hypothetical protein
MSGFQMPIKVEDYINLKLADGCSWGWGALGRDTLSIALSRFSKETVSKIYNVKTIGKQFAIGQLFFKVS